MDKNQPETHVAMVSRTKYQTTNGVPACPYCGGESMLLVSSTDVNRKTTTEVFNYWKCSACTLVFLDPIPNDMTPFYEGGYQTIPRNLSELRGIARKERYRMDSISKHITRGRLLEIGPWMGIFSCNAKDAGFDVTAIEMDRNCVNFLREIVGIRVIQSSKPEEALDTIDGQFEVIALWHSLEHLPMPWLVLQKASEKLAPGGILLVSIPNIESYDFSVLGAQWFHLDAPRHLYHFPIRWLETLGSTIGLGTLEATTSDRISRIISRDAWHVRAASKIPVRYVRGVIGLLLYQFAKTKYKEKYAGGGLTVIFRKSSEDLL
jgi:2-polyprenyl-3-methyl-5-hydroxy-6-metoxy-1,4-benzoquinol methylase